MKKKLFPLSLLLSIILFFISASKTDYLKLHQSLITVDTHCDTPYLLLNPDWDIGRAHKKGLPDSGKQDLIRMQGNLSASFFAVYVAQKEVNEKNMIEAKEQADKLLDVLEKMFVSCAHLCQKTVRAEDLYRIREQGKIAIFLGMENGFPLMRDISLVDYYYQRGIRYITLAHSADNQLCDSATDTRNPEDNGLTDFGRQVVRRMNDLGMMIDISHISEKSALEVLTLSRTPVIASHSCVQALCNIERNLSDRVLLKIRENGGVVQLCPLSDFVKKSAADSPRNRAFREFRRKIQEKYGGWENIREEKLRQKLIAEYEAIDRKYKKDQATIADFVNHIDYVVKLIGIDHAGIGTDFDGGGGLADLQDVTDLPLITRELLKRGYSREDIAKIWGLNLLRVMQQAEAAAERK